MGVTEPDMIFVDTDKTHPAQWQDLISKPFTAAGDVIRFASFKDVASGKKWDAVKRQLEDRGILLEEHPSDTAPKRAGRKAKIECRDMQHWEECAVLWWGGGELTQDIVAVGRKVGKEVNQAWCKYRFGPRYPTAAERKEMREKAKMRYEPREAE